MRYGIFFLLLSACMGLLSAFTAPMRGENPPEKDIVNRFRGLILDQFPEDIVDVGLRPTSRLERLDPAELIRECKKANVSLLSVWAKPQTGFAWYNTKVGTRHPNLKLDYIRNITDLAHRESTQPNPGDCFELPGGRRRD